MSYFTYLDELSDITDITWNDRRRLGPLDKASHEIMRGKSNFTTAQKETFAAYVSGLNACSFCYGSHSAVAKNFGVSPELIESLIWNLEGADISSKERPLFMYLKKLTQSPSKILMDDVEKVYAQGWTEEDLHELILIGCLFNFYNRLLDGHGVKGNQAIYNFGADHLSKKGYSVPWFIGLIKGKIKKVKLKQIQKAL